VRFPLERQDHDSLQPNAAPAKVAVDRDRILFPIAIRGPLMIGHVLTAVIDQRLSGINVLASGRSTVARNGTGAVNIARFDDDDGGAVVLPCSSA
jgi:hypothetical protein